MKKKNKLVIFDMDGVLLKVHVSCILSMRETFNHYNIDHEHLKDGLIKKVLGLGINLHSLFEKVIELGGLEVNKEKITIDMLVEYYTTYYEQKGKYELYLFEGSVGLLEQLKENNCTMITLSSKSQERLESSCEYLGITDYFDEIIGATKKYKKKPSGEIYDAYLKNKYPFEKENIYFIGDTLSDLKFCQNIGIEQNFIWASWGYGQEELLLSQNVARKLSDIANIVL